MPLARGGGIQKRSVGIEQEARGKGPKHQNEGTRESVEEIVNSR